MGVDGPSVPPAFWNRNAMDIAALEPINGILICMKKQLDVRTVRSVGVAFGEDVASPVVAATRNNWIERGNELILQADTVVVAGPMHH